MLKSAVAGLSKAANWLAIGANVAGTLVVLGLVLIVNFDVIARGIFHAPFRGAIEVVQFSVVLIVFLQLPDVVRVDRLTRSDGFLNLLQNKRPLLTSNMRRTINAVSAIFMGIIAYVMYPEFVEMYHTKDYFGVPGVFTAPWWPIKLAITLSAALCSLIFALKVISAQDKPQLVRAPELDEAS